MTQNPSRMNAPDPMVRFGLYVVVLACIIASGDVLVDVAHRAGWTDWRGYLLPILIDLPGFLGGRIWLRRAATTVETRVYARKLTLVTLGTSILGNAIGHLVRAGYLAPGIGMVLACSVVAPVVLWAVLRLDELLTPDAVPSRSRKAEAPSSTTVPVPVPVPSSSRSAEPSRPVVPSRTEKPSSVPAAPKPQDDAAQDEADDLLVQKAKRVAHSYEADHGKPITRDALKSALGCGSTRASQLLRAVKGEEAA